MSSACFARNVARRFAGGSGRFGASCQNTVTRKMTSRRLTGHLERTAGVQRQTELFSARVCGIVSESERVKRLRLEVPHPDFSFRAGQWVDFFIPGVETVGGFSVCSSPGLLRREGVMELAVKNSQHPPARWIHTQCSVDAHVAVRVGGDFYFDPRPSDPAVDLLLVAGGVGINPLYSILLHADELQSAGPARTHLCYSARSTAELLFKATILEICRKRPHKFSCDFRVTRQSSDVEAELQPYTSRGRISAEALQRRVDPQRTLCYLCGPPPMIRDVSAHLQNIGLSESRILFEKWW